MYTRIDNTTSNPVVRTIWKNRQITIPVGESFVQTTTIGLIRGKLRSEVVAGDVTIGATMTKAEAVSELEDPSGIRSVEWAAA